MLTIVIPVKNEQENILDCLNSIGKDFAQKIIVLDSNSEDKTAIIAKNWGAVLINFNWDGKFPKKRNWYLLNHAEGDDWILFLDADERLTNNVKFEIKNCIKNTELTGFWIPYTINIDKKVLKYGYPLNKLSLIKNGYGLYEMINEESWSSLDMEVHEHPILKGKLGKIKNKIEHLVNINTPNWKAKHLAYAKWEAKRLYEINKNGDFNDFTFKQKIKYRLIKFPFIGLFYFWGSILFYLGLLDGINGIKYAFVKSQYFNSIRKEYNKIRI
jgi:glycosyltransferase involved in cell wall biosynthesis